MCNNCSNHFLFQFYEGAGYAFLPFEFRYPVIMLLVHHILLEKYCPKGAGYLNKELYILNKVRYNVNKGILIFHTRRYFFTSDCILSAIGLKTVNKGMYIVQTGM